MWQEIERGIKQIMDKLSNKNWISIKKVGLPELKLKSSNSFSAIYEHEKVLVQTKKGDMFVAECRKQYIQIKNGTMKLNGFHMEPAAGE